MRPELAQTNPTIDTMLAHHSVRKYSNRPLDQDILDAVLAAALSAPTSSNMNSWSVITVRNPDLKRELAASTLGNEFINKAPVFLVWVADLNRAHGLCVKNDLDPVVLQYQEAILVATLDTALAAQNALVAAESLGLGACYVGGIRTNIDLVCDLLELPDYCFPLFGMTLGWPSKNDAAQVRPRLPLYARAFEESYKQGPIEAGIDELEAANTAYLDEQGRPGQSWIRNALGQWSNTEGLHGRELNRGVIAKRGLLDR